MNDREFSLLVPVARSRALRDVASAALRYMDEGGDHPTDDGLHIGCAADARRLSDALDALELTGFDGTMWRRAMSDRREPRDMDDPAGSDLREPEWEPTDEQIEAWNGETGALEANLVRPVARAELKRLHAAGFDLTLREGESNE